MALGLILVAAVLAWRRPGAPEVPPVAEIARAAGPGRPVIFVGLDGADWELLDRQVAAGSMPNLAALVKEGAGGVLRSLQPPLSPLVWTTMMTGVSPLEHGILDFTRLDPRSGREEPITSDERRVPAVWNMATYGGKRVAVVGLWATHPAEAVSGLIVSDRLSPFLFRSQEVTSGLVYPPERGPWVDRIRRRVESSAGYEELRAYLPRLEEAEYARLASAPDPYSHPVTALRRILVETRLHHELAAEWIRRERPDLAIVYVQGTDSIGHVFAPYTPPRQPSIPETDYERYHRVPELYFRFIDGLLGDYRRLAEASGAVLMLASDHGFRWAEGRPTRFSSFAHATAAEWHRREGIYLLWGRGMPATLGRPHRGSVEQVASTLLALLGLPPAREAPPPLPGVVPSARAPVDYAAYYQRPALTARDDAQQRIDREALEKLRALGYLGGAAGPSDSASGTTRTAGSFANECLILRGQGRPAEATAAAEKGLSLDPNQASALWCLSDLLQEDPGTRERSDELLVRAYVAGLARGIDHLAARADRSRGTGDPQRGLRLLGAAVEARPADAEAWRARGRHRVDQGDCAGARADSQEAVRLAPAERTSHAALGLARLCLGDERGARESLARAEAALGEAHLVLARGALKRGELARAEREARRAMDDAESAADGAVVMGRVELARKRPHEALKVLDAALSLRERARAGAVLGLQLLRGDALARLGRAAEAEAAFRDEIRHHPTNSAAYPRLGLVLALRGADRSEVRRLMESMFEAKPTRETAHLASRTLASVGDRDGAEEWSRRVAAPRGVAVPTTEPIELPRE